MNDIKNEAKALSTVVNNIRNNKYNFDLSIQRGLVWTPKQKSLFIDSILRNYPISVALINRHTDTGVLDVVDFKQRFNAIADFKNITSAVKYHNI